MFKEVPAQFDFPAAEREILRFWEEHGIYARSLKQREAATPFVFYEGPPTANGMPHPGHCLTRTIKDVFPRYRTMAGYYCERKAGWDTHGLPVEAEVCKELGIHTKAEIEQYGVEKFIQLCQKSVFRYMQEWEELTRRIGFWVDLKQAYVTYHQSYVESVWWALKTLFDRGLLYQGHKIVWWWPQGGTALSAGEVGQGYREVDDPSVTVRFKVHRRDAGATQIAAGGRDVAAGAPSDSVAAGTHAGRPETVASAPRGGRPLSFLAWTTTPWTLPSNVALAVGSSITYAHVAVGDEEFILAKDLIPSVFKGLPIKPEQIETIREMPGSELVGMQYEPIFRYATPQGGKAWEVIAADFVTLDSGTGIVHVAPAFGEDDYRVAQEKGLGFLQLVAPDGTFVPEVTDFAGRFCKEADADIIRQLKDRGVLLKREQYRHEYPFCWRAEEDPLIQYARKSWFVRTTTFRDAFLANNEKINWLPDHIKSGRFGNFLENNVDWALSRERFWGTPLPVWQCEQTGQQEAVASYAELLGKPGASGMDVWEKAKKANPDLIDDLKVHKPYIDEITYDSPFAPGARMRRVPEVIDCWFDSGAMPFAQWGYPHKPGSEKLFKERFPADFISEAIDQTRGWFYTLLAISTMLFGEEGQAASGQGGTGLQPVASQPGSQVGNLCHTESQVGNLCHTFQNAYPHPFRNCIVLGLMGGEDGKKLSKSKRNYKEPTYIFDREGADAMRWSMLSGQAPWTGVRFSEQGIATDQREFLIKLYNVYSFFVIYASIDKWTPKCGTGDSTVHGAAGLSSDREDVAAAPRGGRCEPVAAGAHAGRPDASDAGLSELDRWMNAELQSTVNDVRASMDRYENYPACRRLVDFVDSLSNWYVRRSRERFWRAGMDADKNAAYQTLWACLVKTSELIAPFTPFFAETLYQNLVRSPFPQAAESVHLRDYPEATTLSEEQERLIREMAVVREIASLGRGARMDAKLKVRQPLSVVELVLADPSHRSWLEGHLPLIAEELNVKSVEFATDADKYVSYEVKPNFKSLGPKFGALAPKIKAALPKASAADLRRQLDATGKAVLNLQSTGASGEQGPSASEGSIGETVELTPDDVQVALKAKPGWAAAQGGHVVVVLSTELTDELKAEGLARDVIHLIQTARKDEQLDYQARICVRLNAEDAAAEAIRRFEAYICGETLATELLLGSAPTDARHGGEVEGTMVKLAIEVVK